LAPLREAIKVCTTYRQTNHNATAPTISRIIGTVTHAAVAQPMAMPASAPGTMIISVVLSLWLRQLHRLTISMTMRIGSRIAAACTGEIAKAISGTPSSAMAPPKPPLESPTRITAGMAVA